MSSIFFIKFFYKSISLFSLSKTVPKCKLDIINNVYYNVDMLKLQNKKVSQRLTLRIPISLYESIKKEAEKDGVTLNQFCLYLLAKGIGGKEKKE